MKPEVIIILIMIIIVEVVTIIIIVTNIRTICLSFQSENGIRQAKQEWNPESRLIVLKS